MDKSCLDNFTTTPYTIPMTKQQLDPASPLPLYHQLAEILLAEIRAGLHPVGERIPSENQLVATFGIGRPTVRQAVESLVRRGLLVRKRGSGTFVAPQPESVDLFSLAGTLEALQETGCSLDVELVSGPELLRAHGEPDNPFLGRQTVCLTRLSRLDNSPVLVEDIFLDPERFPGLETMDLSGQSLSCLVAEEYGFELVRAEQRFRIRYQDERLAGLLKYPRSKPILAVSRFLHFVGAPGAVFSTLWCRTDQFVFTQQIGGFNHA